MSSFLLKGGVYQLNTHEQMIRRVKSIYFYLKKKGDPVHSTELADEFGCATRTIQRDLKILECNHLIKNLGKGLWAVY
jgi:DeoR/GlpR family transcriptional regulator of sugar metabolism